jgi:putative FmdB family regulatory protein
MPLYEYMCEKCGDVEEAIQKFSDKPLKKCKHCSGKLNKLISQSSFHLKGTGWYVTDYANKKPKPAEKEGTEGKEGKSDTPPKKPATPKSTSAESE